MVRIRDLLEKPSILIGFLISFILLIVPRSKQIYLQIIGEYANGTGHEIIGGIILFLVDAFSKLTTWLVLSFLELIIYVVFWAFVIFSVLNFYIQVFKFK